MYNWESTKSNFFKLKSYGFLHKNINKVNQLIVGIQNALLELFGKQLTKWFRIIKDFDTTSQLKTSLNIRYINHYSYIINIYYIHTWYRTNHLDLKLNNFPSPLKSNYMNKHNFKLSFTITIRIIIL